MIQSYIGYSSDPDIRFRASSGGVGTSIVRHLFRTGEISHALSFSFNLSALRYEPALVDRFEDYAIVGSIYHEMDMPLFWKQTLEGLSSSRATVALFCLPCQTRMIRSLAQKYGVKVVIIGLTCSSSQNYSATECLLRRLKIEKDDVESIQYRGNGWPSGVQIKKKDGEVIMAKNNGSVWTDLFHSRLFIQKRCFWCNDTLNKNADIVLADPWLKSYFKNETVGQTLFGSYTELGQTIINSCIETGAIVVKPVSEDAFELSQGDTIDRKLSYSRHPGIRKLMSRVFLSERYVRLVADNAFLFRVHCSIKKRIENKMRRK